MSKSIKLTTAQAEAVKTLAEARRLKAQAEQAEKGARALLPEAILTGDAQGTFRGQTVVKGTLKTRKGLNTKALTEAHPEIVSKFTTETEYVVVTIP